MLCTGLRNTGDRTFQATGGSFVLCHYAELCDKRTMAQVGPRVQPYAKVGTTTLTLPVDRTALSLINLNR